MIWKILTGKVRKHQYAYHDTMASYPSIASVGQQVTMQRHRCHGCGNLTTNQEDWVFGRVPLTHAVCPFDDAPKVGFFEWLFDRVNCWGDTTPKVQTIKAKVTGNVDAA